jgi:hypothetical protein
MILENGSARYSVGTSEERVYQRASRMMGDNDATDNSQRACFAIRFYRYPGGCADKTPSRDGEKPASDLPVVAQQQRLRRLG